MSFGRQGGMFRFSSTMLRAIILCGILNISCVMMVSSKKINHAFGKPVIASSSVEDGRQEPENVVDGCHERHRISTECCFGSTVEQNPWLTVDLQASVMISEITIFGILCPERLLYLDCPQSNPLWVMLFEEPRDLASYDESFFIRHTLDVYYEGIFNITYNPPVQARYVGIKKFAKDQYQDLVLCELEVYGDCTDPTANEYCLYTCNCLNGTCNGPDGTCSSEVCEDGWLGEKCNQPCSQGFYGPNCESTCSGCVNKMCNISDGLCLEGCVPGRKGNMCSEVCEPGTWGPNCVNECVKCLVPCDIYRGTCDQCELGRYGRSCGKKCKQGYYGDYCSQQCSENCMNNDCNHKTGECMRGCVPGWRGDWCQYKCLDTYGDHNRCVMTCPPCGNGTCDVSTGKCQDPCDSGFTGTNCDEECEDSKYGVNCANTCGMCADMVPCDKVTGKCPGGCKMDYTGSTCQERQSRDDNKPLDSSIRLIIAMLTLGVLLCVVGSILVFVYYKKRRKKAKTSRSSRRITKGLVLSFKQ